MPQTVQKGSKESQTGESEIIFCFIPIKISRIMMMVALLPYKKTIKGTKYGNSFIERIFIKDKQYYYLYALLEQTLWLLVLALVLCGALLSVRQDRHILFLQMVILGVSAYVLLFEGRAKYLFMFVPVYLLLAAVGLRYILHRDL